LSLRHLLTHTSGLDPYFARVHGSAPGTPGSAGAFFERGVPSLANSRAMFTYSNVGVGLVGLVIEEVTGLTIAPHDGSICRRRLATAGASTTALGLSAPTGDLGQRGMIAG
jgi:hypothetical protein